MFRAAGYKEERERCYQKHPPNSMKWSQGKFAFHEIPDPQETTAFRLNDLTILGIDSICKSITALNLLRNRVLLRTFGGRRIL